jgi:hypothetical protein
VSWLRIDDGFAQNPKLEGWTAAQKWALIELFCYCARHKTDGYVPADLSLLPRAVTTGLLGLAESSGIIDRDAHGHLVIHDWSVYNPPDPTAADRMKRMRERNANRNGDRNKTRNETVSSRARDPVPSPEASNDASAERKADELWEALREILGEVATDTERGRRNRALKELRKIGATPDQVKARCRVYARMWPDITLTASALVANWSTLEPRKEKQHPTVDEVVQLPEITDEARAENLERLRAMAAAITNNEEVA